MPNSVRPHRRQPTRLPDPWDSPDKKTGVGCHFFLQCIKVKSENEVTQSCPTLSAPWTVDHQARPSMGFSRQEYWSGLPFPFPGDLRDPGIEPGSLALQADSLLSELLGKPGDVINIMCYLTSLMSCYEPSFSRSLIASEDGNLSPVLHHF